eukprot:tig00000571_g2198.t1
MTGKRKEPPERAEPSPSDASDAAEGPSHGAQALSPSQPTSESDQNSISGQESSGSLEDDYNILVEDAYNAPLDPAEEKRLLENDPGAQSKPPLSGSFRGLCRRYRLQFRDNRLVRSFYSPIVCWLVHCSAEGCKNAICLEHGNGKARHEGCGSEADDVSYGVAQCSESDCNNVDYPLDEKKVGKKCGLRCCSECMFSHNCGEMDPAEHL